MNEASNIQPMPGSEPSPDSVASPDKPDIVDLFETEETPLLRYAFSLTGRREVAEELVQEVFLQLHEHWDSVENPKAWLYRSVRNRAYNHNRDHRKEVLGDGCVPEARSEKSSPEELLQRMEAAGFLRLLLAELDGEDRRIIELKYYQDLKYAEISEQTGIKVGTIGYRLHHILKRLAGKLQEMGIDGV